MKPLAELESLPTPELEEAVVFAEWGRLRTVSSRSLTRTRELMSVLGYRPSRAGHPVLGVVGSKGKGTASAYASAALAGSGLRVGTIMSPGILSNADRIRIDGRPAEEPARRRALLRIEQARRSLPEATAETGYLAPTGLFLLMGMLIFQEAEVDAAVAEAGIGGASDDLSHWPLTGVVLTGVFGEHLDLLGPTVADVARDKTGVITEATRFVVSLSQSPEVTEVLEEAVRRIRTSSDRRSVGGGSAGTTVNRPSDLAQELAAHLPAGFQRENASAGVTGGLALARHVFAHETSRSRAQNSVAREESGASGPDGKDLHTKIPAAVRSVNYPGRLSLHEAGAGRCVVDSAISGEGLAAALEFARSQLGAVDQVLVCLPPGKDLSGFAEALKDFEGPKVFVELPGAYTGTPDRSAWPWNWVRLEDLGETVHDAVGSVQLESMLEGRRTLLAGTVLFTSLALRTLRADVGQLFTALGGGALEDADH